jgi:hypothetical protein
MENHTNLHRRKLLKSFTALAISSLVAPGASGKSKPTEKPNILRSLAPNPDNFVDSIDMSDEQLRFLSLDFLDHVRTEAERQGVNLSKMHLEIPFVGTNFHLFLFLITHYPQQASAGGRASVGCGPRPIRDAG